MKYPKFIKSIQDKFNNSFMYLPGKGDAEQRDSKVYGISDPDIPKQLIIAGPNDDKNVAENIRTRKSSWYRMYENIERWRQAIQYAQNPVLPQRILLYRVYDEVDLDNHITACIELRKDRIKAVNFNLLDNNPNSINYGKPFVEESKLFEQDWFYKLIDYWVDAKFWGYTLIQIWGYDEKYKLAIEKLDYKYIIPERKEFKQHVYDINGISYNEPYYLDWLIEIGKNTDMGLFMPMGVNALTKRFAEQNWTQYSETFGMPITFYHTDDQRPEEIAKIETWLKDLSARGYAIAKKDDTLEFVESNGGNGSYSLFKEQIDHLNTEMACVILGADYIDNKSGSHAQSKTKDRQANIKTNSDLREIEIWTNEHIIPKLKDKGFPIPDNAYFKFDRQLSAEEQLTIDQVLLSYYEIPDEYITDKYGVPVGNRIQKSNNTMNISQIKPEDNKNKE
jgi:hypothetical protein